MKRKRLSGEIRFRIGQHELDRIEKLLARHDQAAEPTTVSALLRRLIRDEYDRCEEYDRLHSEISKFDWPQREK